MGVFVFFLQDWVEVYDQGSNHSSAGLSVSAPTPSPSPLTPNAVERLNPSPGSSQANIAETHSYAKSYPSQPSPVKLTPLNEDAISDFDRFYSSPGVSPLKANNRHIIRSRKYFFAK